MRALSSSEMLQLWERGCGLHPLDQALLALAAASPGASLDSLADLPLGERNRALVRLHSDCFGSQIGGWVPCPACGEKLEFELDGAMLLSGSAATTNSVTIDGQSFRLPSSRDLALAAREIEPTHAALALVARCSLDPAAATRGWSPAQIEVIGEQMALADPLAEPRLSFACALCGHAWDELLDLAGFFWTEMEVQVRRVLREVHALARAYGWSETEILTLSEARRALYLDLVRAEMVRA